MANSNRQPVASSPPLPADPLAIISACQAARLDRAQAEREREWRRLNALVAET